MGPTIFTGRHVGPTQRAGAPCREVTPFLTGVWTDYHSRGLWTIAWKRARLVVLRHLRSQRPCRCSWNRNEMQSLQNRLLLLLFAREHLLWFVCKGATYFHQFIVVVIRLAAVLASNPNALVNVEDTRAFVRRALHLSPTGMSQLSSSAFRFCHLNQSLELLGHRMRGGPTVLVLLVVALSVCVKLCSKH